MMNATETEKILPMHRENIGIPVILRDCVIEVCDGNDRMTAIPDLKGLEAAAAVARISIPVKLSGPEIKFIRRVVGKKGVEIARRLDIAPEHLSRIEGGSTPLATNTERVFRWDALRDLKISAPGVAVKDDEILNMSFLVTRPSLTPVTLKLTRQLAIVPGEGSRKVWIFEGVEHAPRLRAIA